MPSNLREALSKDMAEFGEDFGKFEICVIENETEKIIYRGFPSDVFSNLLEKKIVSLGSIQNILVYRV